MEMSCKVCWDGLRCGIRNLPFLKELLSIKMEDILRKLELLFICWKYGNPNTHTLRSLKSSIFHGKILKRICARVETPIISMQ